MRIARTVAAAAVLALGTAACGGGSGDGTEGSGSGSGKDLSGQTLEVAAVFSGAEQKALEAVLDEFEKQTGATVKYTGAGDELPTYLQTKVEGNAPPNVALLAQPGLIAQFAASGAIKPLAADVEAAVDEHFASVWKDFATVDGKPYGIYFKAANKSTFWYNVSALDEAGAEPPETWDDLIATSTDLADQGITPLSVGGADGWILTDWFENIYLQLAGPDKYDQLSKHEIPWTDPSVADALKLMAEALSETNLAGGAAGTLQTDFPTSVTNVFGDDPTAAMVYEGDFVAGVIGENTSSVVGEDAKQIPFPAIEDGGGSVVGGGDAAVAFTDDEATTELMKFLATPEAATIWAEMGGFISPNKDVAVDSYPDDLSKELATQIVEAGDKVRFDMSDLAPSEFGATKGSGEWKALQDFLANPTDIAGAQAALEAEAAKAFTA